MIATSPRCLAALCAVSCLLSGCQRSAEESAEPEVRPVRSITIAKREAGDVVVLSGRVAAQDEAAVAFRISGRMIERPDSPDPCGVAACCPLWDARFDPDVLAEALPAIPAI
jgi:hypothetical protein